jgi:hypothetical protein
MYTSTSSSSQLQTFNFQSFFVTLQLYLDVFRPQDTHEVLGTRYYVSPGMTFLCGIFVQMPHYTKWTVELFHVQRTSKSWRRSAVIVAV